MLPYAYSKFDKMISYGDTIHQTVKSPESLSFEEKITIPGFNVVMYLGSGLSTFKLDDYLDVKMMYE